jgi:hypothetical protein
MIALLRRNGRFMFPVKALGHYCGGVLLEGFALERRASLRSLRTEVDLYGPYLTSQKPTTLVIINRNTTFIDSIAKLCRWTRLALRILMRP